MIRVLVVDDNELMRESLAETLDRAGYEVAAFAEPGLALADAARREPAMVITDLKMPGMSGIDLIRGLRAAGCAMPVVVITAYGTIQTAVEAMREGAYDYITKPFKADALEMVVNRALEHYTLVSENRTLRLQLAERETLDFVVGESPAMKSLFDKIRKLASSSATVLIRGSSGTGKEIAARALHHMGDRKDKPFFAVNCAALSAGLLESELFGHEKGAFTGADARRLGRFELADGGTLLLDEVSEIDVGLQAKLLRVLQEREFERVGSSEPIKVDVRVIATTNRNIEEAVGEGAFRQDLYYRLNVVSVEIPPLAERRQDIPLLVDFFLAKYNTIGGRVVRSLSDAALKALLDYSWPGNIRELANVIERASVLATRDTFEPADLFLGSSAPVREAAEADPAGAPFSPEKLDDVERRHILATLEFFGNNQVKASEALGVSDRTLRNKLKKWKEDGVT